MLDFRWREKVRRWENYIWCKMKEFLYLETGDFIGYKVGIVVEVGYWRNVNKGEYVKV